MIKAGEDVLNGHLACIIFNRPILILIAINLPLAISYGYVMGFFQATLTIWASGFAFPGLSFSVTFSG